MHSDKMGVCGLVFLALVSTASAAPWRCVRTNDGSTVCLGSIGCPTIDPPSICIPRPLPPCTDQAVVYTPCNPCLPPCNPCLPPCNPCQPPCDPCIPCNPYLPPCDPCIPCNPYVPPCDPCPPPCNPCLPSCPYLPPCPPYPIY